jgi:hypothetical protein
MHSVTSQFSSGEEGEASEYTTSQRSTLQSNTSAPGGRAEQQGGPVVAAEVKSGRRRPSEEADTDSDLTVTSVSMDRR